MIEQKKIDLLGNMPVKKAIVKLALPTMAGMLIQVFYNLTDAFFIGKLNDPNQVAAIAIAMPIFFMFISIGGIFGTGGASYISRLLGAKDSEGAGYVGCTAIYTCCIFSIIISIISIVFLPKILIISGASRNTFDHAYAYSLIIIAGSILLMLNLTMSMLIRSEGAPKESMMGMFIGTVINIVLDPVFILMLGMGVKGAAVATLIGNAIGVAYYVNFCIGEKSLISISLKKISNKRRVYSEIFKIGVPASLNQILMAASFMFLNSVVARYGDTAVAGMGISIRIISLPIMITMGLAVGVQPLLGYSYGAQDSKRMSEAIYSTNIYALVISLFFMGIFFIFPRYMIIAFINNADVIDVGTKILLALAAGLPFIGSQFIFMIALQAMGKGIPSLIIAISRQGLIFIPAIIILNRIFDFNGLVFAQAVSDFFTAILSAVLFFRAYLKMNRKHLYGSKGNKGPEAGEKAFKQILSNAEE